MQKKPAESSAEGQLIIDVQKKSIADQLGVCPGDRLLSIDGHPIEDVFDYRYRIDVSSMVMDVLKENGEEWELDIENDYEDPGLTFENGLMSEYRSCTNHCIFCFIDQMPKGLRSTLYFKDDDSRLSFLQGNYVTLTNMKEKDIRRIISYRLEPINISVQTTNPELRCRMLNNRFAGDALKYLKELYDAGIEMNGQIVLCRGYNDKGELHRTLSDLMQFAPVMQSVSVVPVGLSKFREKLTALEPIGKEEAKEVIAAIEGFQKEAMKKFGMHFVHASDEFYLLAQMPFPEEKRYDGYLQLENGVGMMRLLEEEIKDAAADIEAQSLPETVSIGTGMLAGEFMKKQAGRIEKAIPGKKIRVYPIENHFFGNQITVSGLLTGKDIAEQLAGKDLGTRLLLPSNMFRSGEEVFLDDMTKSELEKKLNVCIKIVGTSGYDLLNAVNDPAYTAETFYPGYETGNEGKEK